MSDQEVAGSSEASAVKGVELFDKQGDIAADYLEELLDILDLDGDIDIEVQANRALVSIVESTPGELGRLVGAEGVVLSALQDLTRLAVTTQSGSRARLLLDIAGYREAKREVIRQIGLAAIKEAKESGQPVRMAAMSAFERKVVHDAVAEAGLSSESEGTEPQRYVVISP